ncbi:MAG TPA: serine/threonine-protein kinase, partial [Tepidisphaeraceae bacterium]
MSRTEDLFARAVDLASDQRSRFLDECALDPQSRREIESLLRAHDDAGEFFSERRETNEPVEPFDVGARIGAYELIELLGEGGFARVFRARQSHPVRREVALKLIKLGMDTRAVLQRFELERQALAMMDHPGIATVHDAGVTSTGRPFFVMELVRGDRITRYCENAHLSIANRVRLFIDVCHAVQHAHQKGVLHRDLKPSNILVATVDDKPTPKVIDFGIAKAVGQQLTDATLVTQADQLLGTPQYMSPEQARSGGADVEMSSDVYSLGAVLYELLAGAPPLGVEPSSSSALVQIQRLTSDEEIPPPSTRAPDERRRELRGELDWILGKCLEKDRRRRYVSAAELGSDLQAYLENRPITAAPPSEMYRVRKFIGRNKVAVTAAAIVAASLLIGTIVSTMQAIRATRAERLAQKRLEDTTAANASLTAVNHFLTRDMIGSADPAITRGRELTVREALDNAAKAVPGKFSDNPLIEASVRDSVARAYLQLGRADLAMTHAQDVLQRRTALLGENHPDTLSAMNNYGSVLEASSRLPEAVAEFKHAWELSSHALGDDHPVTLESLHNYSAVLMTTGKLDDAEPLSA